MGPGLNKATLATKSEKLFGFNFFIKFFIPLLSYWNIPSVSASLNSLKTTGSFKFILFKSKIWSVFSLIKSRTLAIIVKFLRAKKSIFNKPNGSKYSIVTPVIKKDVFKVKGITSSRGTLDMTTPAAWVEICLFSPSSFKASL